MNTSQRNTNKGVLSTTNTRKAASPAGKASATSIGGEPKKQKLPLWPEWNEADVNAEKWEVGGKAKEAKAGKSPSAPTAHGFEDPEPKYDLPNSVQTHIESWKRPSELFDKTPIVVDAENGLENFDLITPNEHLHTSETMRWIISQIQTLWDLCKRDSKILSNISGASTITQDADINTNKAVAAGRTWRPWEHIYAVNKVVKGPFLPVYNPHGKYAVRLYFMGCWRKIIVDDLIPVDEKGQILLPQTTIYGELWPIILTKALLKIVYLDFNPSNSATEFNDANIINLLTGWIPEPLPLRFGHISEVWKFLKETLPKYQWADDKAKMQQEEEQQITAPVEGNENKEDTSNVDKNMSDSKSPKKQQKDSKVAATSGKESKTDKHKKDVKDKKGKSIVEESPQEDFFTPDFPETVIFASFTDLPLTKLSAHTEMADRRERLRKYNLNHDFSNPVWITCTRDITIDPPPPPEKIPVWKTIRPRKKHLVPSDEPVVTIQPKPDQWVELKSPYIGYKAQPLLPVPPPPRQQSSRFSRVLSRPQTGIQGIVEVDERSLSSDRSDIESPINKSPTKLEPLPVINDKGDTESSMSTKSKQVKQPEKSQKNSGKQRLKSTDTKEITDKNATASVMSNKEAVSAAGPKDAAGKSKASKDGSVFSDGKAASQNDVAKAKTGSVAPVATVDETNITANGANEQNIENKPNESESKSAEVKSKIWMDFEDFFVCFKSIFVYHKPASYKHNEKYSDLKQVVPQIKQEKKKDAAAQQQQPSLIDEKSPRFLFVDSLTPIEIIVSFSSLSKWYEQKLESIPERGGKIKKADLGNEHDAVSVAETIKDYVPLQSGYLMAEPYSWKSLVTGQPVLRIHTTSTRSALLQLQPGRHVLKFMVNAPIGYHIHLISNTKFSFGDEEEIMPKLTDESCRFVDQALNIMKALGECVKNFSDPSKQKQSFEQLDINISPLNGEYILSGGQHLVAKRDLSESFNNALYEMLKKALNDQTDLETAFAWRAFTNDCLSTDVLGLRDKRPSTSSTSRGSAKKVEKKKSDQPAGKGEKGEKTDAKADKGGDKNADKNANTEKTDSIDERLEFWKAHVPSDIDHKNAVVIQSYWKGYFVRQIKFARNPGSPENMQVAELLKKTWSIIEMNFQENALFLFRTLFKINPKIMQFYSFYKDEWNRITYFDYNGSFADQNANSWLILFRDVFYTTEPVLMLPKLYSTQNNSLLRVIDNDNYKEIPKVFNKVSPYTYTKNKKGYTILAESRILDQPAANGRWRLRLIGSSSTLLTQRNNKTEIASMFSPKEIRDYYVPNENKIILRYKVSVSEDHLASLQLTTSKSDVYIKFSILDNGEEVFSTTGKGSAVIPAFIFSKDRVDSMNSMSRPGSKTLKGSKTASTTNTSSKNKPGISRSSSRQSLGQETDDEGESNKTHKYIIEAVVLRNSWPLTPSQWAFANSIKETEVADLKVFSKDRVLSPTKDSKTAASSTESKAAAAKAAKAKAKTAKPAAVSRPASSQFDTTKPHWTLRVVSDSNNVDEIEVKKDVDRQEEIKSMKRAWESAEPGRAAKAMLSRIEYLKTHMIRTEPSSIADEEEKFGDDDHVAELPSSQISTARGADKGAKTKAEDSKAKGAKPKKGVETKISDISIVETVEAAPIEEVLLNRPPTPPKPKTILPPLDTTNFVKATNNRIIKDESIEQQQAEFKKREIEQFNEIRERMVRTREEERKNRMLAKLRQLDECETLQEKLDNARKNILDPREMFRQRFLEAERKRLEELAAKEAQLVSQAKPDPKDKKKGSAGKAKGKK